MPYALFCNEAKLSKTYPTEADVWKQARQSGLVADVVSEKERPSPRPVLDNDYEIRPCPPDPLGGPRQEPGRRRARSRAGISARLLRGIDRKSHPPCKRMIRRFRTVENHRHLQVCLRGHEKAEQGRIDNLRRRHRQRGLLGGKRHAGLPAVQTSDRAGDLEHLAGRT